MTVGMTASSSSTTSSNKNNHTGEPAIEREGLLLGGPSSAASTSAATSDERAETRSHQAGDEGEKKRARSRNWRKAEAGLAELRHGRPTRSANIGGHNRAEVAAAPATTPGSHPRSPFEPKITATSPKAGGDGGGHGGGGRRRSFPSRTPPHIVEARSSSSSSSSAENGRKGVRALTVLLAVAALLCFAALLSGLAGLWKWQDVFPYKGATFNASKNCRAVHTGPEEPCSNILESTCFDRSRCLGSSAGGGGGAEGNLLSVYVHDETCSMKSSSDVVVSLMGEAVPSRWSRTARAFRQAAESREVLAATPGEACIVVYVVPTKGECVSQTPTWGKGQNHLLVDMNDQSREQRSRLDHKAMFAEANMRPCYFRYGYDIAIPLLANSIFHNMTGIAPQDRKYFATFKGSLYLSGNGFPERTAVRNLGDAAANDSSVVVVEKCQIRHKEHLQSRNVDLCEDLQREYDETDYSDLMNTTFALVPAGRSPASYRLGEALSAGAIPVFIHQNFVKPFPGKIPWSTFSFSFPAEEAPRIIGTLRAVPVEKLAKMQTTALEVFDSYFGRDMNGTVHTTLDILEERLSFRGRS